MKKNIISLILAGTIIAGIVPVKTYAATSVSVSDEENMKTYKKGTYEVDNTTFKMDDDSTSAARTYVSEKSIVVISDDGITASLEFIKKNIMTNTTITVNGYGVSYNEISTGDNSTQLVFPMTSLSDSIKVTTTISLGFMNMPVSFRVILDVSDIPMIPVFEEEEVPVLPEEPLEEKEENPTLPENPSDEGVEKYPVIPSVSVPDTGNGNNEQRQPEAPIVQDTMVSHTIYKVRNEILTDSAMGYSAARSAVNSISYFEEIDGIKYVTVGLSQLSIMNNIRLSVNGTPISYEILRKSDSNHTMDIRFKVSSIEDRIKFTAFITMTSMDISFGFELLENTMELITISQANTPLAQPIADVTLEMASDETAKNEDLKELSSDIEAQSYFKRYTIENEIISDSVIGKNMTSKYLDKTCILEDIDGQLYLTIKLTGTDGMSNIKISVNGKEADVALVSYDEASGDKCFRFKLDSISDDIRIYMTIKAVNKEVNFGIELLQDTMILLEEGSINSVNEMSADELAVKMTQNEEKSSSNAVIISSIAAFVILSAAAAFFVKKKK